MIAVIIFSLAIVAFFFFSLNTADEAGETIDTLNYDAANIANNLLSEGYPLGWNSENVIMLGILSNSKINETKLESFFYLSQTDYQRTKSILKTRHDYYITFSENITISNQTVGFIGNISDNPQNLIKATRLATYRNKPLVIYIHAWD